MCFYIQKIYKIEIIQMKAKFAADDHGTLWFQHADEILVRDLQLPKVDQNL